MKCTEKVAYLRGLMDGLEIDTEKGEGKVIAAIVDVLDDLAHAVSEIGEAHNDLCDQVDALDSDLGDVEEYLFDEDDEDDDCDCEEIDGELYEVECPACGDTICIDEGLLEEGGIDCPGCGEHLEFDLDEEEEKPE